MFCKSSVSFRPFAKADSADSLSNATHCPATRPSNRNAVCSCVRTVDVIFNIRDSLERVLCPALTAKAESKVYANQRRPPDRSCLLELVRLAVDKVVHHDHVVRVVIVWTGSDIARCNSHGRDARVAKLDAEKRETAISRRSRRKAAEQQPAVSVKVLDQSAGSSIAALCSRTTSVGLINIREDHAKTSDRSA